MANRADTFDRADSTTTIQSPSDGGSDWVVSEGTWGIATNRGYKVASDGSNQAIALEASTTDAKAGFNFYVDAVAGPIARWADTSNYLHAQRNGGSINLFRKAAGSFTNIGSGAITFSSGQVIEIEADSADLITARYNGSTIVAVTETAGAANTKHGIYANSTSARFEGFYITDSAAAAIVAPPKGRAAFSGLIVR